jgi:RNA polymerase-binding transcription factor DksA
MKGPMTKADTFAKVASGGGVRGGTQTKKRSTSSKKSTTSKTKPAKKGRFSQDELDWFRESLLQKRRELLGDYHSLHDEAVREDDAERTDGSERGPQDVEEQGTDVFEQMFTINLMQNTQATLREVDEALERIEDGSYGTCVATGKPITKTRLRALPWAKHCIEYATQMERNMN